MITFWGLLLIVSGCLLVITLIRSKYSLQWLSVIGLNLVVAVILLYVVNWFGASSDFHIAINQFTVVVIAILGVPGLLLLVALKLAFV